MREPPAEPVDQPSEDYPLGNLIEPYDIWKDNQQTG